MLTLLEVRGQGGTLSLPLIDATLGYDVQDIQGLDPVRATLVSSNFAQQDGAQFHSARRETRNITMKLGLSPDYSLGDVRTLRLGLYPFLMPKSAISMRFFMDDDLIVDIAGRVETFESAMFSKEPAVDVSILCYDPDFLESNAIVINGSTTAGTTDISIDYTGSVESGIELNVNVNRTMAGFTIYHQSPDGTIRSMDVEYALLNGDVVTINTVSGYKFARLTRGGIQTSILYGIPSQAAWVEFETGINAFRVYASGATVPYTVTYTRRYGGL